MKRYGHLFDRLASFEQLLAAYRRARRGARTNQEVSRFCFYAENELLALQAELLSGAYEPRPYRYFKIYDPKERVISVADFRDRVVHHALVGVLEPVYERTFIFDSYATRKGKGTHAAILRAQQFLKSSRWFFKTDVDKYFDSVRHDTLLGLLERKIKDPKLLCVAERIVGNGGHNGQGLPIGNLTSQFFANVYLNGFDHFVQQHLRPAHYLRYMDDFTLFDPDKEKLKTMRKAVADFLENQLYLHLKPKATFLNSASNGLTFLGKRIFPSVIRVAGPNLKRIKKCMALRKREFEEGHLDEGSFLQSMNSHWAHLSFGAMHQWRQRYLFEEQEQGAAV